MAISFRPYRRGGFEADIRVTMPDGTPLRERRRVSVSDEAGARLWAERREIHLALFGREKPARVVKVPRLEEFWPRFIKGHAKANKHKPSGIEGKESVYRNHIKPALGAK